MTNGTANSRAPETALAEWEQRLRAQIAASERLLAALERSRDSMGALAVDRMRATLAEVDVAARALEQALHRPQTASPGDAGSPTVPPPADGRPQSKIQDPESEAAAHERIGALRARARHLAERIARANGVNRRIAERAGAHFGALLVAIAGGGGATYAPVLRGETRVAARTPGLSALVDRVA
jgi:hypothetical protein